ncbi:MAG: SEC-C metal-binding domain-containing protein [Polyangiaceae bacterium]
MSQRNAVGRNDPCPCGSGKKFKKCCSGIERTEAGDEPVSGFRAARKVIDAAGRAVLDGVSRSEFEEALDSCLEELDAPFDIDDNTFPYFSAWVLYHHRDPEGQRLAEKFLARRRLRNPEQIAYLRAALAAPFSFWEVLEVDPGRGLRVRDLLTGQECFVVEQSASGMLRRWEVLFAAVVDLDAFSVFDMIGPYPLPPGARDELVTMARTAVAQGRTRRRKFDRREIAAAERELAGVYHMHVARELFKPPPHQRNTDGHALVFCQLHYRCSNLALAEVLQRLGRLGYECQPKGPDDDGHERCSLLRAGNAMHRHWENTVIAEVQVANGEMTLEVNSRERADEVASRIESEFGPSVSLIDRTEDDVNLELRERWARRAAEPASARSVAAAEPEPEIPEEMRGALDEMISAHYEAWLDTPVPALAGLSPREAAASKRHAKQLDGLLREIECHADRMPELARFDTNRLRDELGMTGKR